MAVIDQIVIDGPEGKIWIVVDDAVPEWTGVKMNAVLPMRVFGFFGGKDFDQTFPPGQRTVNFNPPLDIIRQVNWKGDVTFSPVKPFSIGSAAG